MIIFIYDLLYLQFKKTQGTLELKNKIPKSSYIYLNKLKFRYLVFIIKLLLNEHL
jgi:hypothetical protein